jgi:hypothetical protein
MSNAELLLLTGSVFVVYAASVVGSATVLGRTGRLPPVLQTAIAPGATTMGVWRRRAYLGISLSFMVISQGLLLLWLVSNFPNVGDFIVVGEFAVAMLMTLYIVRPAPPPRAGN